MSFGFGLPEGASTAPVPRPPVRYTDGHLMAIANWKNQTIWTGDNLDIMRGMNSESVDLIYLDPPFNSKQNYAAPIGSEAAGAAFKDSWTLDDVDIAWIGLIAEKEPCLPHVIDTAGIAHGKGMKAYLVMMAVRLLEMRRLLKPTGSIYLHCDPTASHYLKLVMDCVFGAERFQNEIVWRRYDRPKGSQHKPKRYGRSTDIILFYTRGENYVLNADRIRRPLDQSEIESRFPGVDGKGRFMSGPLLRSGSMGDRPNLVYEFQGHLPGPAGWRMNREKLQAIYDRGDFYFTANGVPRRKFRPDGASGEVLDNVWADIPAIGSQAKERIGYPTQKPLALLNRIIEASSNKGDIVLDPFCGCATTCVSAHALGRLWTGIDISEKAADLIVYRLEQNRKLQQSHMATLVDKVIHRKEPPQRTDVGKLPPYKTHKHTLYGRQEGKCAGCGHHFPFQNFTVDHVVAKAKGGTDHIDNLQLLCNHCNSVKGTMDQAAFKVKLSGMGLGT